MKDRKKKINFILSIIVFFYSYSLNADSLRSIGAHLLLQDYDKAFSLAEQSWKTTLQDLLAYKAYLHAIAMRDERLWIECWSSFKTVYPEEAYDPKIVEPMAWALLERASKASGSDVKQLGLIAAGLTRDVRSIPIILRGLQDGNAVLREIAVEMAMLYGDAPLKSGLKDLYEKEKIRRVRLSLIHAFGRLHMQEMMAPLLDELEKGNLSTDEQFALVESLLLITKKMNHKELEDLVTSERSSLRILASEVISKYQMKEEVLLLWKLAKDPHPLVAISALKSLGLLRITEVEGEPLLSLMAPFLESKQPSIAITASWLVKLQGDERGDEKLLYWIREGDADTRALVGSAVAALGGYGIALADQMLEEVSDPFARANLALALIGERHRPQVACEIFAELLRENKERWMAEPVLGGIFSPLKKSTLPHRRGMAHYPELVSQVIKLQMASLLAVLEYEGARTILKEFLLTKNWQVTGLAAELLLEEGDEEGLACIRELLQDKDPQVVLEAALILAVWGYDESALPYLLEGYKGAKIEMKIKILEALTRIQEKSAIPFLVECMKESSYLIRIIAASVLLQTMNH